MEERPVARHAYPPLGNLSPRLTEELRKRSQPHLTEAGRQPVHGFVRMASVMIAKM